MGRTLHGWKTVNGRVLFGGEDRDNVPRGDEESFRKAQDRKKRRHDLKWRNAVRSLDGQAYRAGAKERSEEPC